MFFFHFTTSFLPLAFLALFRVVFLTVTLAWVVVAGAAVVGWLGFGVGSGFVDSLGVLSLSTVNVLVSVLNSLFSR